MMLPYVLPCSLFSTWSCLERLNDQVPLGESGGWGGSHAAKIEVTSSQSVYSIFLWG